LASQGIPLSAAETLSASSSSSNVANKRVQRHQSLAALSDLMPTTTCESQ
jgi:hypothetical protein